MNAPSPPGPATSRRTQGALLAATLLGLALAALSLPARSDVPTRAQSCPPYCETPVVTPAWHMHMCDVPFEEQGEDMRCMRGKGVTEFPNGTDRVYVIYCHRYTDTVRINIKDSGGGEQYVNYPDGITYEGEGCETLEYRERNGIPPGGSPYYTSASWPEGPFSGVGAGIEWFVGLFAVFDADFYYGLESQAHITARDPAANLDPTGTDRIRIKVYSDVDPEGFEVELVEQSAGYPVFKTEDPIRFSTEASDPAASVLQVRDQGTLHLYYCPRECQAAYEDEAVWLAGEATVTPTPLPTYAGPRPTATRTPAPETRIEYVTLHPPSEEDVGYVPQISNNKSRINHLGYPDIFAGMWTKGDNRHYGMIQFDLDGVPQGARAVEARLELIGRSRQFLDGGEASVELLHGGIDAVWRDATYDDVHGAQVLGRIGLPLADVQLAEGRENAFGFAAEQLAHVDDRLATTRKISFRVSGPEGEDNNLFSWESGADVYGREPEPPSPLVRPRFVLGYAFGPSPTPLPPASATPGAPTTPSATPDRPVLTPSLTPPSTPGASATASATPSASASPTGPGPSASPATTGTASPQPSATGTPGGADPSPSPSPSPSAGPSPTDAGPSATPGGVTATPSGTPEGSGTPDPSATPDDAPRTGRQVCVLAFDDRDGDGVRAPEERLLAGVTLRLEHRGTGAFVTWTTDASNDPDYCWNGLSDGRYQLRLTDLPRGLAPTGPDLLDLEVPLPVSSRTYAFGAARPGSPIETSTPPPPSPTATESASPTPRASLTPTAQPTVVGARGEVCAEVFEDRSGEGFRDLGEPLLHGQRIEILDETRALQRALTTRLEPVCSTLPAGVFFVRVVVPQDRVATTPEEQAVLVTDGSRQELRFGWREVAGDGRLYLPLAITPGEAP